MKVEYYLEESDYGRHSEYRDMAEKLFGILRIIDIPDKQDGDEVVTVSYTHLAVRFVAGSPFTRTSVSTTSG